MDYLSATASSSASAAAEGALASGSSSSSLLILLLPLFGPPTFFKLLFLALVLCFVASVLFRYLTIVHLRQQQQLLRTAATATNAAATGSFAAGQVAAAAAAAAMKSSATYRDYALLAVLIKDAATNVLRKCCLLLYAMLFLCFSWEERGLQEAIARQRMELQDAHNIQRQSVIFIRHGESVWNATFNRPLLTLSFPLRFFLFWLWELFLAPEKDSVLFDSPLSTAGIAQAAELRACLRDEPHIFFAGRARTGGRSACVCSGSCGTACSTSSCFRCTRSTVEDSNFRCSGGGVVQGERQPCSRSSSQNSIPAPCGSRYNSSRVDSSSSSRGEDRTCSGAGSTGESCCSTAGSGRCGAGNGSNSSCVGHEVADHGSVERSSSRRVEPTYEEMVTEKKLGCAGAAPVRSLSHLDARKAGGLTPGAGGETGEQQQHQQQQQQQQGMQEQQGVELLEQRRRGCGKMDPAVRAVSDATVLDAAGAASAAAAADAESARAAPSGGGGQAWCGQSYDMNWQCHQRFTDRSPAAGAGNRCSGSSSSQRSRLFFMVRTAKTEDHTKEEAAAVSSALELRRVEAAGEQRLSDTDQVVLVSSNLRRSLSTLLIALGPSIHLHVQPVRVLSCLQEATRFPDALSLSSLPSLSPLSFLRPWRVAAASAACAPSAGASSTAWRPGASATSPAAGAATAKRSGAPPVSQLEETVVGTSLAQLYATHLNQALNRGNKWICSTLVSRLQEFAAWLFREDGTTCAPAASSAAFAAAAPVVVVVGHSRWLRYFFKMYYPPDLQYPAKTKKLTNCGILKFDVLRLYQKDCGRVDYLIDPVSCQLLRGAFFP